jgi:serine/threonine-protein kinase
MSDGPQSESGLPAVGDVIAGKFRIERLLGRGGMGAVFAAHHEFLNQRVALKLVLGSIAQNKEARDRFLNEARAAFGIQSEHIARVLDVGEDGGRPFMVLEYLEGSDLAHIVEQRGPLPVQEAVDYVMQALDAIGQAHAKGIIHRDLKPANLFIVRGADGQGVVKVLDFGISKMTNPLAPDSGGMTSTKAMLGSPYYMSPEQLRSSRTVDARTDIWALGIILHELLTGEVPYKGDNLGELFANILEQDAPPIGAKRPDVPVELQNIVLRCLQRKADHRYGNVWELAKDLVRFASQRAGAPFERLKQVAPNLPKPAASPSATAAMGPIPNVPPQQAIPHATPPGIVGASGPLPPAGTTPFTQFQQPPPGMAIPAGTPPNMMARDMMAPAAPLTPAHPGTTAGGWGGQTGTGSHDAPVAPRSSNGKLIAAIVVPVAVVVVGFIVVFVAVRGGKHVQGQLSTATASVSATGTAVATSTAPPDTATATSATAQPTATVAPLDSPDGATAGAATTAVAATATVKPSGTTKPTATVAVTATTTPTAPVAATTQPTATQPHPTATAKPTPSGTAFDPFAGRHQ